MTKPHTYNPDYWHETITLIIMRERIEYLLPTGHEVALLSAFRPRLYNHESCSSMTPSMNSLCRIMDKITAAKTLRECGFNQPDYWTVTNWMELYAFAEDDLTTFPVMVKEPFSRNCSNVRLIRDKQELIAECKRLEVQNAFSHSGCHGQILIQTFCPGRLVRVQAVYNYAEPVA